MDTREVVMKMSRTREFSAVLGIALILSLMIGMGVPGAAAAKPRVAIVFATGGWVTSRSMTLPTTA
jgi:hypothetical protein